MQIEEFRNYCLSKKGAVEDFPFDENTLVYKVMGKIFAITDVISFESVNLKCDPDYAVELREQYDGIIPGFHMNKKHWNTVFTQGSISKPLFLSLIDHSYDLVVNQLPKKEKQALLKMA